MQEHQKLQSIYHELASSVRASSLDESKANNIYAKYLSFIENFTTSKGHLLDVGCGTGWSSYLLSKSGYRVTGIDLNAAAFEMPEDISLNFVEGSALQLPFEDRTFDLVASHNAIEHMPDPQTALLEMLRVLKPQGMLFIVCPNLLSIGSFFPAISKHVWCNRPLVNIFLRSSNMPAYPWGSTLPELIFLYPIKLALIVRKLLSKEAFFSMRKPDLKPPFRADNDACYLSNPIDLVKFLLSNNCKIVRNGYLERPKFTNLIASGTFIVAQKIG